MSVRDASNVIPPNPSTPPSAAPFEDEGYGTDHETAAPAPGKRAKGHAAKGPDHPVPATDEGYGSDTDSDTKAEKHSVRGPEHVPVSDHDEGYGSDTDSNTTSSTGSAHSFWDEEQKFDSDNELRHRKMSAYLGTKATQAADNKPDDDASTQSAKGVFKKAHVVVPHHGVLSKTARALKGTPELKKISAFITSGLNGSNSKALSLAGAAHVAHMALKLAPMLNQHAGAPGGIKTVGKATKGDVTPTADPITGGNITSIVFMALADSMASDNKTKTARLNDMQKFNKISQLISDYISNVLQPAQAKLDMLMKGKDPQKSQTAEVMVNQYTDVDTDDLYQDAHGNVGLAKVSKPTLMSASSLSTALTAAQGWAQNASNNSSQASNRYQATDTASGSTYSLLTEFIKNVNTTINSIVHNQV